MLVSMTPNVGSYTQGRIADPEYSGIKPKRCTPKITAAALDG